MNLQMLVRRALLAAALLACALGRPGAAHAQANETAAAADTVYEIRLRDGSVLVGRIVADQGATLTVQTQAGLTVTLQREQVVSITERSGRLVDGRMVPQDPHATRLFFAPTARAIPRGEGYFGVYELFFPFVSYGLTDRFTISAGTPIVPDYIGQIFYFAPKYEIVRTPGASAAVGVLAVIAPEAELDGSVGLIYGVGTFGNPDGAITVGATVPFVATTDDSDLGNDPVFMIGAEARTGLRTKIISENYFVPGEGALVSAGMRFFGERLSADFGVGLAVGGSDPPCCLPLVNFVYSF
ncbi:MAG TPA: hypothetical protein VE871_08080 [Longimicrobium sp.]|nr:hypothetical protein [Longimicrobium sp.]